MNDLFISIVRGILAFVLGWATVLAINLSTSMMLALVFPELVSVNGMPSTTAGRWVDLALVGLACIGGTFVIVATARRAPRTHALIFGASVLAILLLAFFSILSDQPLWYKGMMLVNLAPQITIGAVVALRIRNRNQ